MAFRIVFLEGGRKNLVDCIEYVYSELKNPFAARKLEEDIFEAIRRIGTGAASHALCEDPSLRERNLRKLHLRKHRYKIFYRIDGDVVYIEAILHDKQDVEKALK